VAALNQSIDVAAAGPFVEVLRRMFGRSSRDACLGLPVKPLDELYANPAGRFVEQRGGIVRVNASAHVLTSDGLTVTTRRERIRPDAVICAAPWYALPDVFTNPVPALNGVLDAARRTAASPIVTVNLWFDRAVTDAMFVGLPGRTMQWLFVKRALFGTSASHVALVSSGADAIVGLSNDAVTAIALRELSTALPRSRDAVLRRAVVVREKRATFSVAPDQPLRPGVRTGVRGLFLAGDWIDTGLPATIEGAVLSGHRAADAVLEHLAL
jgi:zeta-carotene desaturase